MKEQSKIRKQLTRKSVKRRQRIPTKGKTEPERRRVRDALQESEDTTRGLLNATDDSVLLIDKTGTVLGLNEIAAKRFGKSISEILGSCIYNLLPPDVTKSRKIHLDEVICTGKSKYFEDERQGIVFANVLHPILDKKGKVVKLAIYARDITERKQAEEEILSLARFPSENPIPVLRLGQDGTILYANKASQLLLKDWGVSVGSPAAPFWQEIVTQALGSQSKNIIEVPCKEQVYSFVVAPIADAGYVNLYGTDITERKRAEEELRKASLYARSLIEASLDPLVTISSDGKIMDVNQATEQVTGITRNRLIGSDFSDYFTEPVKAREGYQRVLSEGLVRNYPLSIRHISGRTTDVLYNATIYRNEAGEAQGVFAAARDITERKQAEEKLRDSEVRYRDLIETARDVILTLSPQGVFTSFNRVFETITGWSTKEWIGKVFVDLLDPNDVPKAIQRFKSVMEGQLGEPIELRVRTKYGGFVPGEFVASPQVKEGKVIGILGVVRDITERKRAEEALRQEKDFNQTLVQASPLFFVAIGPDGKTLMMNEAMLHALGYTTDEVVGKDYLSTFVPVADRERLLPIFQKLVNQKESTLNENRVLIKDGRELLVEWHGRPVFKANGDLDYFIGVGIDITHRRQVAEKMAVLQDQLRQSQKMEAIGRLAGGVAHDFNNLLTVIKGYCQLSLAEMKESTPIRDALEVINKATEKAADLTRQLLAFSRRQIMEVRVLDLNALLQNLDKMLRRIIGEDIELVTLLGEDLGRVKADPGQIEQVVMNLAVNAKDAMSKGGNLIIETADAELDEAYAHAHVAITPGRYVMIAVSDTGTGMTPEVRDRVFEPFFTTKGKDKGTGLGLSTVYGIVKQSNGNIWVYSEPGKGTTFKIFLPRVDEPADKLRAQSVKEEFSLGSETILVVEDDKEVRNLAVRILKRQGYTVLDGSYGDEALNVCRNHQGPIHLLLTDVVMPGMSGHELAKRLESFHPEMKVLYMSGYTDDAIVMHGILVQGVNYIQKPFTVDALAKKVREVLEQ